MSAPLTIALIVFILLGLAVVVWLIRKWPGDAALKSVAEIVVEAAGLLWVLYLLWQLVKRFV